MLCNKVIRGVRWLFLGDYISPTGYGLPAMLIWVSHMTLQVVLRVIVGIALLASIGASAIIGAMINGTFGALIGGVGCAAVVIGLLVYKFE